MKPLVPTSSPVASPRRSGIRTAALFGALLGGSLSFLYSMAISSLISISALFEKAALQYLHGAARLELQFDFFFGTIIGLIIGLLPSLLLGGFTALVIATLFKIRPPSSAALKATAGAVIAFLIGVAIHAFAFFAISSGGTIAERLDSLSLFEVPAYYVLMGIPSIIYILAGAVAGKVIGDLANQTETHN